LLKITKTCPLVIVIPDVNYFFIFFLLPVMKFHIFDTAYVAQYLAFLHSIFTLM